MLILLVPHATPRNMNPLHAFSGDRRISQVSRTHGSHCDYLQHCRVLTLFVRNHAAGKPALSTSSYRTPRCSEEVSYPVAIFIRCRSCHCSSSVYWKSYLKCLHHWETTCGAAAENVVAERPRRWVGVLWTFCNLDPSLSSPHHVSYRPFR